MKKIKFNFGAIAVVLGLTAAFAFKSPEVREDQVLWTRISPTGNTWTDNIPSTAGCEPSSQVCKAYFPDDYNPNLHDYEDNMDVADVQESNGYVQQ